MPYSDISGQTKHKKPCEKHSSLDCIENLYFVGFLIVFGIIVLTNVNIDLGSFNLIGQAVVLIVGIAPIIFFLNRQKRKPQPNLISFFKISTSFFMFGMIIRAYMEKDFIFWRKQFEAIHETIGVTSPLHWNAVLILIFSLALLIPVLVPFIYYRGFNYFVTKKEYDDLKEMNKTLIESNEKLIESNNCLSKSNNQLLEEKGKSNITNWDQLIGTIIEKKGDILIIVGNLMLINTEKGITYLKKYLEANNDHEVKIITSRESCKQLDAIVDRISDPNLASRIEVISYRPFWFVQGIAIIAKKDKQHANIIIPLGCFFYKVRESEDAGIPESGIYIDLSNQLSMDDLREVSEGLCAHYSILKKLEYEKDEYSAKKTIIKTVDGKVVSNYNPIKKINLGNYSRSNSGTVH